MSGTGKKGRERREERGPNVGLTSQSIKVPGDSFYQQAQAVMRVAELKTTLAKAE